MFVLLFIGWFCLGRIEVGTVIFLVLNVLVTGAEVFLGGLEQGVKNENKLVCKSLGDCGVAVKVIWLLLFCYKARSM